MKFKKHLTFLIVLLILWLTVSVVHTRVEAESGTYDLVVSGSVHCPLNFTYNALQKLPMVSEVALMRCVAGWTEVYNWTGIPLFFLLSMTGVKTEATEVVFYASDGFSSSLSIERALHPTTLLALQANGTFLSNLDGYPYRLVVPCKYGYKWVKWITEIEVIDYDYKGYYESLGYSDEADIPDCIFPETRPSFEVFHAVLGNTTHSIITLSNSTINSFDFDRMQKQICFNVTGPPNTTGYCYATIPKDLLWSINPEHLQVWINGTLIKDGKVLQVTDCMYIYITYMHSADIEIIPEFPTWTLMPLVLIALTVAVVICKRRLLKIQSLKK